MTEKNLLNNICAKQIPNSIQVFEQNAIVARWVFLLTNYLIRFGGRNLL
jgi:Na+-transporting NADH:ubiquinone oxidoreductase subunit NqrD